MPQDLEYTQKQLDESKQKLTGSLVGLRAAEAAREAAENGNLALAGQAAAASRHAHGLQEQCRQLQAVIQKDMASFASHAFGLVCSERQSCCTLAWSCPVFTSVSACCTPRLVLDIPQIGCETWY